jgi:hypothetical protein
MRRAAPRALRRLKPQRAMDSPTIRPKLIRLVAPDRDLAKASVTQKTALDHCFTTVAPCAFVTYKLRKEIAHGPPPHDQL